MITSSQFISRLAKNAGLTTNETANMLNNFACIITELTKNEESVNMQGFGTFELKKKSEKKLLDPRTHTMRVVPASKTLTFKQSPILKAKLTKMGEQGQETN